MERFILLADLFANASADRCCRPNSSLKDAKEIDVPMKALSYPIMIAAESGEDGKNGCMSE